MNAKCSNCGANLEYDDKTKFCPYCGAVVEKPEDPHEFEKWKLNHEETVRQRKNKELNRKNIVLIILFFVLLALLWLNGTVFWK